MPRNVSIRPLLEPTTVPFWIVTDGESVNLFSNAGAAKLIANKQEKSEKNMIVVGGLDLKRDLQVE